MSTNPYLSRLCLYFIAVLFAGLFPGEAEAVEWHDYPELRACSKIYVVAPDGDDRNPGTVDKAFRTISRAAELLEPGEGVLVKAGIYRERVAPARGGVEGRPIVYMAEKGRKVFIKGSDVWKPDWIPVKDRIYAARPDDGMFTDDVYWDSPNPLRVQNCATPWNQLGRAEYLYLTNAAKKKPNPGMAKNCDTNLVYTLGQLFVDGQIYKQVPYRSDVEKNSGSWFFDGATGLMHVHFADANPPAARTVELTTRRRVFAPHRRGLGYITVMGFVMEHCGNTYPRDFWVDRECAQAGALGTRAGHHWVIRDNVIRFANGIGVDIGTEGADGERRKDEPVKGAKCGDNLVEKNWILDNGAAGVHGYQAVRAWITGNVLERNNALGFTGYKRYESAAIKLHAADGALVDGNLIRNNGTHGIWFDAGFGRGARICRNVIIGNAASEHGVFVEMGRYGPDTGLVDNNVIIGNKNAFYCHDGSGVTATHNLLAGSRDYGINIRQVGPRDNTKNHAFFNNIVVDNAKAVTINYPAELGGGIRLDHNIYKAEAEDRVFFVNKYSKFDPAWKDEAFADMVAADFGANSPDRKLFAQKSSAALTFEEWGRFWASHGDWHDQGSRLDSGVGLTLDPDKLILTLDVSAQVCANGSTVSAAPDRDFSGNPIPADGKAIPGPFQNVKPGRNVIRLWSGISPDDDGIVRWVNH